MPWSTQAVQAACLCSKTKLCSFRYTFLPHHCFNSSQHFQPSSILFLGICPSCTDFSSNNVKLSVYFKQQNLYHLCYFHACSLDTLPFIRMLSCAFIFSLASFPKCFCDIVMQCWLYFFYSPYPSSLLTTWAVRWRDVNIAILLYYRYNSSIRMDMSSNRPKWSLSSQSHFPPLFTAPPDSLLSTTVYSSFPP